MERLSRERSIQMLPTVIQGATPLFGATLVPDPDRLLDEVHASGVTAFDSGLVYADEGGTCDGRLGAWAASRGVRESVVLIGKGCHPGPPIGRLPEFRLRRWPPMSR